MAVNSFKQLREFLLWARKERIVLSSVAAGGIAITIERDHGLAIPSAPSQPQPRRLSLVEEFAGPLLQGMQGDSATTSEPTVEDEE